MSRKKAIRRRQERPLVNQKSKLPPDVEGNRQQRRSDQHLTADDRAAINRPRQVDDLLDLLDSIPGWEGMSPKQLGKRLGVRPVRAKVIKEIILNDPVYREHRANKEADQQEPP